MVGKRLSSGLLLFALFEGSYSYAEHPTEPAKSDTFEETPQKPTTRAPSSSIRQYSASSAHVGVTVIPEGQSSSASAPREGVDAESSAPGAPTGAVRTITVGKGAAVFSTKEERGVREYSVGPNRALPTQSSNISGRTVLPASLLVWLGLSRLAGPMLGGRGMPFGHGAFLGRAPHYLPVPARHPATTGAVNAEDIVFEPHDDRDLDFSSSLWAW